MRLLPGSMWDLSGAHKYLSVFYLAVSGTYKKHYERPMRGLFGSSRKLFGVSV